MSKLNRNVIHSLRTTLCWTVLMSCIVAAPLSAQTADFKQQEQEAIKVVNAWNAAWETGDPQKVASYVAEDCVFRAIQDRKLKIGRAAFMDEVKMLTRGGQEKLKFVAETTYAIGGTQGTAVLQKRIDYMSGGGQQRAVPLAVFFFVKNGVITEWLDIPLIDMGAPPKGGLPGAGNSSADKQSAKFAHINRRHLGADMKNRRDFLADTATLAVAGSVLLNNEAQAQVQTQAPSNGPPRDPNQLPGHTDFVLSPQADPYELLTKWLDDAKTANETDPTAVALGTVDASGMPDVRMMHFNGMRDGRFLIQLEINTPKGEQLHADPKAALMFYWRANGRQVRIRGNAEQWSAAMADAEWASDERRPRVAKVKISAWHQSQVFEKAEDLEQRLRDANERIKGTVPRPPNWFGYSITPLSIEFWLPNPTLLHERLRFIRASGNAKWRAERLVP